MEARILFHTARSAVLEIPDGGLYETLKPWAVILNGKTVLITDRVITNLFHLKPDTVYEVEVVPADETAQFQNLQALQEPDWLKKEDTKITFHTDPEFVTLNVRDFGASGDGVTDDTLFIQAAIAACPAGGRVLIPKGNYRFRCLFLKSDLSVCLEQGAVLSAFTIPEALPVLPGVIQAYNETDEYNPGSWEGNPLSCRTGLITGFGVSNVVLYGEGILDGCAAYENWWDKSLVKALPARPRLLFLNRCSHVTVQGLMFKNSPSWTIHPYFSDNLAFYGSVVENPAVSPNTDGMDPESCTHVQIVGMRFSLGDDCIAVKSGKIYMARKYRQPCEDLVIRQCLLENGHGAVTIGSEMAGGVIGMTVEDCIFRHTDRGLRIKTRRGRGKDAVVDKIIFRNIKMERVMTPLVVNCFYFCDPDGHTSYVQSRQALPADERTPRLERLCFENMECVDCQVRAAYIEGLPEQKLKEVVLRNVSFSMAKDPAEGIPAMTEGVEPCAGKGIYVANAEKLILDHVTIVGQQSEPLKMEGVDTHEIL